MTQAQLYDAYFMHGQNDPTDAFYPYSANGMADWTDKALNGTPATGVNETVWLTTFLQHRKDVLTSNGQVWADATNRVDLYSYLVTAGAFQLDKTIVLQGGSCGASGVCSNSSSSVTVGPSVYGSFTIP